MNRPVKIIVVGGNAAGPAAAAKAKRFNAKADVVLFEASDNISTGTCEMPYVLSGEIDDFRKIIFYSPASFRGEKGVKVFIKHLVQDIDRKKKRIVVNDLEENKISEQEYDKLILTTGSKAKTLPGFDLQLKNVFALKSINDLVQIDKYIIEKKVKNAIIIGSGFIGLESAEALIGRKIKVKLLEREVRPLPIADIEFSHEILKSLQKNGLEFIGNVKEIEPVITDNRLIGIRVDEKFLETDLILIAVGFEPDTFLAQTAKLELGKSGAIKVDQYLKTSDSFVFAAGDNVEFINSINGKPEYIPLATHAYEMGRIAGENAAGGNKKYEPFVKNITVKIFDKFFSIVGLTSAEAMNNDFKFDQSFAKVRNLVSVMPESDYVIGKVLAEKETERIIGGSFLGGKEVSGYADLISALIKLKTSASILTKINYNYTPPLSPFINLLRIIGKKFE